jgi:hypothetical protein
MRRLDVPVLGMRRNDICLYLSPDDRVELQSLVPTGTPRAKLVWRAQIVLATADGHGTFEIMRRANTSKPTVWRWQARYLEEGVDGLKRDKTRPSRVPPLPRETAEGDRQDGAGEPAQCHPLEPQPDGRGGGHLGRRAWAASGQRRG